MGVKRRYREIGMRGGKKGRSGGRRRRNTSWRNVGEKGIIEGGRGSLWKTMARKQSAGIMCGVGIGRWDGERMDAWEIAGECRVGRKDRVEIDKHGGVAANLRGMWGW